MSFPETILDSVTQYIIKIEKQIQEIKHKIGNSRDIEAIAPYLSKITQENQTIIDIIKNEIEIFEETQKNECNNQVGCFQQLCNCPASDSDYPTDIVHKKYCRFYRDRIGC